eukprot:8844094-Pyramimonas_sp.AAC.1
MVRGRGDGCLFMKLRNKARAGGRADDFPITGPSDDVDILLKVMGDMLKLADAAKLAKNGRQATFLGAQVEKVEGGCAINGKTSLIDDILKELALENAR